MKHTHHALLGLAALVGALASGCAAGAHSTASRTTYLAQSFTTDCRPGDSSMVCCIKKFSLTPVESCGATAAEAAEVLNGLRVLNEATQSTEEAPSEEVAKDTEEADDFANNANLPEWRQECIRYYVDCQNKGWTGSCHDCIRRCEGQHEWPFSLCAPPEKR